MWIVFAHVAVVFVGFALTVGVGIFLGAMLRTGDVPAIRAAVRAAIPLQSTGGFLVLAAALIGLGAAVHLGFDLHARWLWISMLLVVVLLVDGFGFRFGRLRRLSQLAQQSPDDAPSPTLRALLDSRAEAVDNAISGLAWLGILVMMIVKP